MNRIKELISWKWSLGDSYKKSARIAPEQEQQFDQEVHSAVFMETMMGLSQDEQYTRKSTKREEQNSKLSERTLMIQKNVNPFMDSKNYVEDLNKEDEFLRPKDSNK
mgnify:CR=1 FL=1